MRTRIRSPPRLIRGFMRSVRSLKPTTPSAGAGAAAQVPTHFLSGIAAFLVHYPLENDAAYRGLRAMISEIKALLIAKAVQVGTVLSGSYATHFPTAVVWLGKRKEYRSSLGQYGTDHHPILRMPPSHNCGI